MQALGRGRDGAGMVRGYVCRGYVCVYVHVLVYVRCGRRAGSAEWGKIVEVVMEYVREREEHGASV